MNCLYCKKKLLLNSDVEFNIPNAIAYDCPNGECKLYSSCFADYINNNNIGWGTIITINNTIYHIRSTNKSLYAYQNNDKYNTTVFIGNNLHNRVIEIDEFYPMPNKNKAKFCKSLLERLLNMKAFL